MKEVENIENRLVENVDKIATFVWKSKDGAITRLIDMSKEDLQKIYNHTMDMLYNTNKYTPGRLQVKKNIKNLIENCNAELLMRHILYNCNSPIKSPFQLIEFIRVSKKEKSLLDTDSSSCIFEGLPSEFESVSIEKLMDACFDKLDIINRKMISEKFILSQGIWLTEEEKEDLTEFDENNVQRPWLDVVKERLIMPSNIKLRVDPKGFSFAEFRALIHLEPFPKISKLPTNTLKVLRDKVFILLDSNTDYYINKWMTIKQEIEEVANYNKFVLVKKDYN